MLGIILSDWGQASEPFDEIQSFAGNRDLSAANEAQTRFDVIDRFIREVLCWRYGQISVEEYNEGEKQGYVDYLLRSGDYVIVVEAKKFGSAFPSPTKRTKLKLSGSVLGSGEVAKAIEQAEDYAKTKHADVVVVTNGLCWCFYSTHDRDKDSYASLLFPFNTPGHAEQLFGVLSVSQVESGALDRLTNRLPTPEDRLISVVRNPDGRVDRNNIADYIAPALNNALYADALLSNADALEKCFVTTDARTKFDSLLGMHLADPKPELVTPARRIRRDKAQGPLEQVVKSGIPSYAPPVTLIIGPVGAGKSTYLKHFELTSGRAVISQKKAHWIYIDFEKMGRQGLPRNFLYRSLLDYLLCEHPDNPTDFHSTIQPAYADEIAALARGPYALIFNDKVEFNKIKTEYIRKDFEAVEPFVDKVFRYISKASLCVIVLDNVDLYEDEELETTVFAEGLALSKRIYCHIIVSIRDTTFVKHRTDSTFDAYELRKLWLDPPPFKAVLSNRLSYAKKILEGRSERIPLGNSMHLFVPDLSVFFEIVQQSILRGQAGDYIDSMADLNIRKGLGLVTNFLTSGHIQADRALQNYINGETKYSFPFHEIFKGTMLAQWRHFREDRTESVNLFDSRLGVKRLRLLRLALLNHLVARAQHEQTLEVPVTECIRVFSKSGASETQILECLIFLYKKGLIRNASSEAINVQSRVIATRSGGFYAKVLTRKFVYVEESMFDTAIEDADTWQTLSGQTNSIEAVTLIPERMELRRNRIRTFIEYLVQLEEQLLADIDSADNLAIMEKIKTAILEDVNVAVEGAWRNYSSR